MEVLKKGVRCLKRKLRRPCYKALAAISPALNTRVRWKRRKGSAPDLLHPSSFAEKLTWLKLYRYADDPLVVRCADKLAVRGYVEEHGFGDMLNLLYAVCERPSEIPWDDLPPKLAVKWNFATGFNVLIDGAPGFDREAAVRQLEKWGRDRFWLLHGEMHYKRIPRRLLCEKYIDPPPGGLVDYKFYCFHGKPLAVLVIERGRRRPCRAVFMTPDWRFLSDIPQKYASFPDPPEPRSLARMVEAAEALSAPFPFVRIDFYETEGRPMFGEMTFTPAACLDPAECPLDGRDMGSFLRLESVGGPAPRETV